MFLHTALRDLEIAERAIDKMASAEKFDVFYEAWQDFLYRIERAWGFSERELHHMGGFDAWFSPYAELRRKDPLLRFLRQARHAETHAVSATLDKPIELLFRDKFGRPFRVNDIKAEFKDGVLTINVDTPDKLHAYDVSVVPTNPKLLRFKNRGEWYNPPKSHLGNRTEDLHPIIAAKLGLDFYRTFVKEGIAKFDRTKRAPTRGI
ncbi:MAG: hypothetical protein AB1560_02340 [Pseudomonadota bacterium]